MPEMLGDKMNVLCIDPGLHKVGVFAKTGDKIVVWDTIDTRRKDRGPAEWWHTARAISSHLPDCKWDVLCIETMVVYITMKGLPKDLLEVQGAAGAFVGMFAGPTTEIYGFPSTLWTHGVPKNVRHNRLRADPDKLPIVRPSARLLDAWDAYGIYLYWEQEHGHHRPE